VPPSLARLIADLFSAMERGDYPRFRACSGPLWDEVRHSDPETLTAAVEVIAPRLDRIYGVFAKVAVLAGALVELGASPLALVDSLPQRAYCAMELHAMFPRLWAKATNGQPLPDPRNAALMGQASSQLEDYARRTGRLESDLAIIALSWFDLDDWLSPLITVMQRREFRIRMSHRDEVRDNAAALAARDASAAWVHGLSLVLDDEPLVALDPATGRGFRLVLGGVGDNFQLHTLLADRLIGDPAEGLLPGERPEPAWVAAATGGRPGPFPPTAPITRRFRLFDGHGSYLAPEGRPADIAPLEGTRVVVLHPPNGSFGWRNGRVFQNMAPTLALERALDPAEAECWLSRVAPARETDLMKRDSA
jgi:hypothetical protein